MIDRITYFSVLEELDKVLLPTTVCDYTKITPEMLWSYVNEALEKSGIATKFSAEDLKSMKKVIIGNQKELYDRKGYAGPRMLSNPGFDQNNYYIKGLLISTRNSVMRFVLTKCTLDKSGFRVGYNAGIGTIEEIINHIDKEKIRAHVRELFTFTKEDKDNNLDTMSSKIANTILLYYGIEPKVELTDVIIKIIEDAYEGAKIYRVDATDSRYNEGLYNMQVLRRNLERAVDDITNYVSRITQNKLDVGKQLPNIGIVSKKSIEVKEESKKSIDTKGSTDETVDTTIQEEVSEYDFEILMKKYEKMQLLVERNKALLKEISELEELEREFLAKLEELRSRKSKLTSELDTNNDELGVAKRSGSK